MGIYVCLGVGVMHRYPQSPEESNGSHGIGVIGSCNHQSWCCKVNSSGLQEQYILFSQLSY